MNMLGPAVFYGGELRIFAGVILFRTSTISIGVNVPFLHGAQRLRYPTHVDAI
jgi:succinate-acetate transporter protein